MELLKKLLRFLPAIHKILQTLVDVFEDLADDGARNYSNSKKGGKTTETKHG